MNWEPWTGCYKISDGCTYCYFYGPFSKRYGQNNVYKTNEFDKPIAKTAKGIYKIQSGKIVATCFASDFFYSRS
jgi:Phage protein Gp37/Gp68.